MPLAPIKPASMTKIVRAKNAFLRLSAARTIA
jgi:hypothetical protein